MAAPGGRAAVAPHFGVGSPPADAVAAASCLGGARWAAEQLGAEQDAAGDWYASDQGYGAEQGKRRSALVSRGRCGASSLDAAGQLLGAAPPPGAHVSCGGLHLGGPAAHAAGGFADLDDDNTTAFKLYEFKVRRCTKTRAHDWTECPFTHPGEKARRRDPRRFAYCGTACPDFRKGSCRRGDACEFAHGVFECWLHPARYRTQSCKDGAQCARRVCFFAHRADELRAPTDPFGRAASPPKRGAGSASPNRHAQPSHSPSQASSASPPRSASPPQPGDTFADLAAYGMLPSTVGRAGMQQQQMHGRRVCSVDGGSRPLLQQHSASYAAPPPPSYYGSAPDAAAASLAAAAASLAHLHLAAGQAAAAAQQHAALVSAQQQAGFAAPDTGIAIALQGPRPAPRRSAGVAPLSSSAPAAAMYAPVPSLLAAAHLAAAQQAMAVRVAAQTHLAAVAAAASLAGHDLLAAAEFKQRPAVRTAPAAATFPRPSSFAHLGIIEGVLDDEMPAFPGAHGHAAAFAGVWPQEQQAVGWA